MSIDIALIYSLMVLRPYGHYPSRNVWNTMFILIGILGIGTRYSMQKQQNCHCTIMNKCKKRGHKQFLHHLILSKDKQNP